MGTVINNPVHVRLEGTQIGKVVPNKTEEHFLEERTQAIKRAYKKLATRDLEIAFDKEPLFYTLKHGQHQK
jgi:hypothetical protein